MFTLRKPRNRLLALLLVSTLALGPIGCGAGAVLPVVILWVTTAGLVALTIYQFQQIESAQLNIEMQRLRLRGMRMADWSRSTGVDCFTGREDQLLGKVIVNGQELLVTRRIKSPVVVAPCRVRRAGAARLRSTSGRTLHPSEVISYESRGQSCPNAAATGLRTMAERVGTPPPTRCTSWPRGYSTRIPLSW